MDADPRDAIIQRFLEVDEMGQPRWYPYQSPSKRVYDQWTWIPMDSSMRDFDREPEPMTDAEIEYFKSLP